MLESDATEVHDEAVCEDDANGIMEAVDQDDGRAVFSVGDEHHSPDKSKGWL